MPAQTQMAFEDEPDYEIVDGQMEIKMAGARHGRIGAKLIGRLENYLESNPIGGVYLSNTTFMIGANERMPDVSFVSYTRFPEDGEPSGKWEIAPDLAVEVISPMDVWDKVNRKVREYFAAGVQQVWLISQPEQEVMVYDSPTRISVVTAGEDLTSETLLPGFKCRVGNLFHG